MTGTGKTCAWALCHKLAVIKAHTKICRKKNGKQLQDFETKIALPSACIVSLYVSECFLRSCYSPRRPKTAHIYEILQFNIVITRAVIETLSEPHQLSVYCIYSSILSSLSVLYFWSEFLTSVFGTNYRVLSRLFDALYMSHPCYLHQLFILKIIL